MVLCSSVTWIVDHEGTVPDIDLNLCFVILLYYRIILVRNFKRCLPVQWCSGAVEQYDYALASSMGLVYWSSLELICTRAVVLCTDSVQ